MHSFSLPIFLSIELRQEKVASAKEMLLKLKEIISGHVANEDEMNKSITKLTSECARLSESLEKSVTEVTNANIERTLALVS